MLFLKPSFPTYIIIIPLLALVSCNNKVLNDIQIADLDTIEPVISSVLIPNHSTFDDSIDVDLKIEKSKDDFFDVIIDMHFFGDTWIVSPLEQNYPYGVMTIKLNENNHFVLIDSILENPISKTTTDLNWETDYKIISGRTTLSQKIKLKPNEDFEVQGEIFFVLEPICTLNEIFFKITNKDSKLTIQKVEKTD